MAMSSKMTSSLSRRVRKAGEENGDAVLHPAA